MSKLKSNQKWGKYLAVKIPIFFFYLPKDNDTSLIPRVPILIMQ